MLCKSAEGGGQSKKHSKKLKAFHDPKVCKSTPTENIEYGRNFK
jgi:hypothetical protein